MSTAPRESNSNKTLFPYTTLVRTDKPKPSPATEEASLRVVQVGQKLLAANPQIGLKPLFSTIGPSTAGPPAEEIFHAGKNQVVITETLVRKIGRAHV